MIKIKNRILSFFLTLILILNVRNIYADDIKLDINGKELQTKIAPYIYKGRTLVPLRLSAEALGFNVNWLGKENKIELSNGSTKLIIQIDSINAVLNKKAIVLDIPPRIKDGTTFVPIRFIAENMGVKVSWNNDTRSVILSTLSQEVRVAKVIDGDTISVIMNGKKETVRLLLIDAPESVHPNKNKNTALGLIASSYTKDLLQGKSVKLEFDRKERDRYGRLLAYVYIDGEMVNELLLENGYAKVSVHKPNIKYLDRFTQLEKEAEDNKLGIWADSVEAFKITPITVN